MSTDLRTIPNGTARELAPVATDLVKGFALLDSYAGGEVDEAPRLDALATISAGQKVTKDGKTFPSRSRDGTIVLHDDEGRAPGLRAALEATGYKRLTIAFPFDDPRLFIQQRFVLYSATKLEIYGDEREIRVLGPAGMVTHRAGTAEYEATAKRCKVSVSVYFTLAEWGDNGPEVVLADGLGMYRLRFTSRNSLRSIVGTLKHVAKFSHGRVAGIPFDLVLVNRDTSDGQGVRRDICVWTLVMRPPDTLRLTSRTFADTLAKGLKQGEALMLPAPSAETLEWAAAEGPDVDLDEASEEEAALIGRGGACNRDHWLKRWHALVDGTELDSDEARAAFLDDYTAHATRWSGPRTRSLGDFLLRATEEDASALIAEALDFLLARGGSAADADPLRMVRLQRQLLETLTEPLSRDAFRVLAMQLPGFDDRAAINAALQIKDFMAWEAQGRGTWADALRILHAQVEAPPAAGEPTVIEGEVREVSAPATLAGPVPAAGDAPTESPAEPSKRDLQRFWIRMGELGLNHEEVHRILGVASSKELAHLADAEARVRAALEARAEAEAQEIEDQEAADDGGVGEVDPLVEDALAEIAALRGEQSARPTEDQLTDATQPRRNEVGVALAAIGLKNGEAKRFVEVVFDKAPGTVLSVAQADVLDAWAKRQGSGYKASKVMAVYGGRSALVGS